MGGEQQKDGRAAAGQGCNHPLPLQPGSERKDQCPVLWAQRQLFSPQLLLPFTTCQLAAVEERAMACIARLLAFSNTCPLPEVGSPGAHSSSTPSCLPSWSPSVSRLAQSLGWAQLPRSAVNFCCLSPQVCSCFTGAVVLQHQCTENQRFPVLGKLSEHLICGAAAQDGRTRDEAMKAVHQLFIFITSQSERSCVGSLLTPRCPGPSLTLCVLLSRNVDVAEGSQETTTLGGPANFAPPGGFPREQCQKYL